MKQTAVEWLYNKFSTCTSDELVGNINNWFEQAKAMEKEQIINALHYFGIENAEQYYNETFKSE
jgi:predicted oxidoreductase (fatty acid repression mutant protein)